MSELKIFNRILPSDQYTTWQQPKSPLASEDTKMEMDTCPGTDTRDLYNPFSTF